MLALDALLRLLIWSAAFAGATTLFNALGAWPASGPLGADAPTTLAWAWRLAVWVALFNLVYLAALILLRSLVPTPREGRYDTAGGRPDRQVVASCLLALLTKARYEPPFPAFLVAQLAGLPPLDRLVSRFFGPRSRSCNFTDPRVLDPHLVTLGRNVVIGFNATIAGHYQERQAVVFQRTVIEDDALIGGHAVLFGGVHVKSAAMVGAGAVVLPGTVIGPNEFWAGVPARKLRDLGPLRSASAAGQAGAR